MKDAVYFAHDADAHYDPKIIKLRAKRGREGYGLYWAILEVMRGDANIVIKQCDIDAIALRLQQSEEDLVSFIDLCVIVGLFIYDEDDKSYYSKRLQENAEYMRAKSKKASASANARWKGRGNANALPTEYDRNAIHTYIHKNILDFLGEEGNEKIREEIENEIMLRHSKNQKTSLENVKNIKDRLLKKMAT